MRAIGSTHTHFYLVSYYLFYRPLQSPADFSPDIHRHRFEGGNGPVVVYIGSLYRYYYMLLAFRNYTYMGCPSARIPSRLKIL